MKNPFDPKKEEMNYSIFQRFIEGIDWLAFTNQFMESCYEKIWKDLQDKLRTHNPDILTNFDLLHKEICIEFDTYKREFHKMDKKVKKCVDSTTLYQDVYKIKDELKKLKDIQNQYKSLLKSLLRAAQDEEEILEKEYENYGDNG
jgi:hypothetical protein